MAIRKAVVLAAGFGTRLRPLTALTPKPLLPVLGVPMLERVVDSLGEWGVEEVAVNAHYLADRIETWAADYNGKGGSRPHVTISVEQEILGTGGALRPLADWIGADPFWLVNGDVVFADFDPRPVEAAFERSGGFAGCWLSDTQGPRTVEADPEGLVCNWKSDDPGINGTYTYCGAAVLSPDVLRYLPETPFCSVVQAFENAMFSDERFVVGVTEPDAFWSDAGTPESYAALNKTEDGSTEFIGARGSDRAFWRVQWHGKTAIAVLYDDAVRKENARYAGHARFLKANGVPVPEVLSEDAGRKTLVLEDVGRRSLEELAQARGVKWESLYRPVLDALARFASLGEKAAVELQLEPAFDAALYGWERDLFEEYCVRARFGYDALPAAVRAELEGVAAELEKAPRALVHRDFQSSNVLYGADGKTFAFIDFQGMRLGPAAYDVAALLWDPYVDMPAKVRAALVADYADPFFKHAAVQRLVQALGAYGRLVSVGQTRFEHYIMRGLGNLLAAADDAGLDALGAFVEDLIAKEKIRQGGFEHHHHDHDEDEEA